MQFVPIGLSSDEEEQFNQNMAAQEKKRRAKKELANAKKAQANNIESDLSGGNWSSSKLRDLRIISPLIYFVSFSLFVVI